MHRALRSGASKTPAPTRRRQAGTSGRLARIGLLGLLALVGPTVSAGCHEVALPPDVSDGRTVLVRNGVGLREATWLNVDVYVAGLYLPAPTRAAALALASETPKQMRLHLMRDVSSEDMAANIRSGFRRAAGSRRAEHEAALEALLAMIPPLSAGDVFILDYRPRPDSPAQDLRLVHGRHILGNLPGGDFARTLFAIWIGDAPLDDALKAALLGGPCNG